MELQQKKKAGFTLIELLVVIAIIAILIASIILTRALWHWQSQCVHGSPAISFVPERF
ncbi:MAG: prepilin-type N-terminal cleavage/methylation domain-containing protein [Planctomycetaceae bacterium]